jgi:glycosyltransferase involved in cell wall biosynthesis
VKILHVISSGGMYGAEAVILNLSHALNEAGHQSSLGIFQHAGEPNAQLYGVARSQGIQANLIPCQGQADRSVPASIRRLALKVGADIVHAHGYKADVYAWLAMRSTKTPIVSTCHTWYDNDTAVRIYGAIDRWVLKSYSGVVAVSESVRSRLIASGVHTDKIRLIRNGIDLRSFGSVVRSCAGSTGPQVGLVGRLSSEKGIDIFIRAAARVLDEFPDAQFKIVGDGPLASELSALISQLEKGSRIAMLGRCDDMMGFYESLDLLVSASRHEGLPVALLEGMASGLAVVATAVGAVPMLVLDGETGRLVAAEDIDALAEGIRELLRNPDLRQRCGEAGRARIESDFSAEGMASEYLDLYQGVLVD